MRATTVAFVVACLLISFALPGAAEVETAPDGLARAYPEGSPEAMALPEWPTEEELFAAGLSPAPVAPDPAQKALALAACETPVELVEGLGPACRTGLGTLRTFFDDGSYDDTHEDIPPPDEGELGAQATRGVACVADTSYKHFRAIYAYPKDRSSRYSSVVESLRTYIREANYVLNAKVSLWGDNADYIYRCASGTLSVASVQLPLPASGTTRAQIIQALKDKGYTQQNVKYVVFWDSSSTYCYGSIKGDSRAVSTNANNVNGDFWATMGTGGWNEYCTVHETFHTMGAVQLDAPHSDGGWHCTDNSDYMCYSGSRCTTGRILDCYADDYCHGGAPPSSNYLYNHWNVCHSRNSFIWKR